MADLGGGLSTEEINRVMDLEWEEAIQEWEWYALHFMSHMPPMVPFPSYCVSRRCGWCRFMIKPGEVITARSSGGTESAAFTFDGPFDDTELLATFKRCESDHDACATIGYHVTCSNIASNLGLQKNDFLDVARYSYEPSSKEDERRYERILNHLNQVMRKEFTNLPTEILFMVNKHLVLHYAIASLSGLRRPKRWRVAPHKDVWATHFSLNGIDYISSLSNTPRLGSQLLWKASDSREEQYLYISEDYLGIRHIVNDPSMKSAEERHNGLWRTLPIEGPILNFYDDGLKLRRVGSAVLNPTIYWPYPMMPRLLKSMAYHVTKRLPSYFDMTKEARMVALNFNEPGITAYSTCWYEDRLIDIHAHEHGESLDFYQELDEDIKTRWPNKKLDDGSPASIPHWVYLPLNNGEKIEQVWLRTENDAEDGNESHERRQETVSSPQEIAIALLTSHSRVLIMGMVGTIQNEWKCIAWTSTGSPMRVFFNSSMDGVSLFAGLTVGGGDSDNNSIPARLSNLLDTETKPSNSGASLGGVEEVVICKDKTKISGLLLRYTDGKQTSIGRFRFDCAEPPLFVVGLSCLYTGYRLSDKGKSIMEAITLSNSGHEEGLQWNKMPLDGIISWEALSNNTTGGVGLEAEG
ncbi:hypothetical protein FLONG3_10220 [Fusarium longipes]|uniref:Uncharacterized protein n=1 Tax=Fusarium longipes TaxID=694270 RepID=A0A395RQN5_9HYPO|nr:hypothetical protein FLONG3_10220 [Fusarium longipes]